MCIMLEILLENSEAKINLSVFFIGLLLGITLTHPAAGVSCPPNWSHHAQSCYLFVTGLKAEWIKAVVRLNIRIV